MFKKTLVILTLALALFSQSAFAFIATPLGKATVKSYIDNFDVTPMTFNPEDGETATVSFDLSEEVQLYSYVIDSDDYIVAIFSDFEDDDNFGVEGPGHIEYKWYGTEDNEPDGDVLPEGNYTFKTFAFIDNSKVDNDYQSGVEIYIPDGPEPTPEAPEITNLMVHPDSFDAFAGEKTEIAFSTTEDSYVSVAVTTLQGATVKTFSNYDDDFKSAGNFLISWNGKNNNGQIVADGNYKVNVEAENEAGDDTAYTTVKVKTGYVPPTPEAPEITNLMVHPDSFDAFAGEKTEISFTTTENSNVAVTISKSNTIIKSFSDYDGDFYNKGSFHIQWDGKSNNGTIVNDGTYSITVAARNSEGEDIENATVTVKSGVTPPPPSEEAPDVTDLKAVPGTFDPNENEITLISFKVDKEAAITFEILDSEDNIVATSDQYDGDVYDADKVYLLEWNGTDNQEEIVADGVYTIVVKAENSEGSDTEETTVTVKKVPGPIDSDIIKDFTIAPDDTWDPYDENLDIEFELVWNDDDNELDSLIIEAENEYGKTVEIYEEDSPDDGDYEEEWDGTDDDGDYIKEGTWTITVKVETEDGDYDEVEATVVVEYEQPGISEAFVTKTSFDPDQEEFTHLVFELDTTSIVTVEVYKGSKKKVTLLDEVEVDKNKWKAVKWDGTDDDGDIVDEGSDWKFVITAENPVDDDVSVEESVNVDVEEDDVSSKKVNVTNDATDPVIVEQNDEELEVEFCLDGDAEVYLAIYDGKSASGKADAELLDYVDQEGGCHTITWDMTDTNGKKLKDDVYSWKIISKSGSNKDTETGRFVIGETTKAKKKVEPPQPPVVPSSDCGGYWDTKNLAGTEMCDAIDWATDAGIFSGYEDGSFKANVAINRAETLKVIFEAFPSVTILPASGSNYGFKDIEPYAWYAQYVRTAKFYGMLHGYLNETEARLYNTINRVELLKFTLEAVDAFTAWEKPGHAVSNYSDVDPNNPAHDWFFDYAGVAHEYELFNTYGNMLNPAALIQRGEVALLLYRLNDKGLLN